MAGREGKGPLHRPKEGKAWFYAGMGVGKEKAGQRMLKECADNAEK